MIAECSVAGGAESFASQITECSVIGGTEGFGGMFLVAYHHPSPLCLLPHSYKWGNVVPMSIYL